MITITPLPQVEWITAHPWSAVVMATVTGFIDGINPCAISTLLLFISALLVVMEHSTSLTGSMQQAKRHIWLIAGSFMAGNFILYFALGTGFIQLSSLKIFGNAHLFTRAAALLAVMLGFVLLYEQAYPQKRSLLTAPKGLHNLIRHWSHRTTAGAAFIGGILIGMCTIPCGGALYLAIAAILATIPNQVYAYTLLTVYNVAFIFPLIILVQLCSNRVVLGKINRMQLEHRRRMRLILAILVILIGLATLY